MFLRSAQMKRNYRAIFLNIAAMNRASALKADKNWVIIQSIWQNIVDIYETVMTSAESFKCPNYIFHQIKQT
jgi:hypothetical protein